MAIPFQTQLPLLTLANGTVLVVAATSALGEDLFVISVDSQITIRGLTAGETPIYVGLNHSDYTVAEIAEALDVALTDPNDKIEQERSRRLVRRIGVFAGPDVDQHMNQGVSTRTKCLFTVGNDFNLEIFARNQSGAALTTGSVLEISGTIYGRWRI